MITNFAATVDRWVRDRKEAQDLSFRLLVYDLFSTVVRRSPVDTGLFRGNWRASIDSPTQGTVEVLDKTGAVAIAGVARALSHLTVGHTAWLSNNLVYARPLEYGHSQQAPEGMVRVTIAEFRARMS